jgi:hypothetical protein
MPTEPIHQADINIDFSQRFLVTVAVVASPAAAAETIIAQLPAFNAGIPFLKGVYLQGWAAYTVGTAGVSVQFRVRQTNVSGSVIANTGALTGSQHGAGILSDDDVNGFDTSPAAGQVYVLTMQVASANAASTVSAVCLSGQAI